MNKRVQILKVLNFKIVWLISHQKAMATSDARSFPRRTPVYPTKSLCSTDTKQFKSFHVKAFHGALFVTDSMWICGWNTNIIGQKNIVFFNVRNVSYTVFSKTQFKYPGADQPILMFEAGGRIFFAKRDGDEILSFSTETLQYCSQFRSTNLTISAMCGSADCFYIVDKNQPGHIKILDSRFNGMGEVVTGLKKIHECVVDMCLAGDDFLTDTLVVCTSFPLGSVRLLDKKQGVVWQVDVRNNPELPLRFNPYSVSATSKGVIFFADRYDDKVSKTCMIKSAIRNQILSCTQAYLKFFVNRKYIKCFVSCLLRL